MQSIQVAQASQRLELSVPSFNEDDSPLPGVPGRKRGKYLFVSILLVMVFLIVWSVHYRSAKYEVVNSPFEQEIQEHKQQELIQIPHDVKCYTQGLSFINRTHLLESCGLYKNSYFQILEYKQQKGEAAATAVYKSKLFENHFFLEGSVVFPQNSMIYILTWQENVVFRFDAQTLKEVDRLTWESEGWGLTHNKSHLIVSDGSETIYIVNEKMQIQKKLKVMDHLGNTQDMLNELEWIQQGNEQFVLANVYMTSTIVKISLRNGEITAKYTFDELATKEAQARHRQVMNGIAYHVESKTYLLTGKQWGSIYQTKHL